MVDLVKADKAKVKADKAEAKMMTELFGDPAPPVQSKKGKKRRSFDVVRDRVMKADAELAADMKKEVGQSLRQKKRQRQAEGARNDAADTHAALRHLMRVGTYLDATGRWIGPLDKLAEVKRFVHDKREHLHKLAETALAKSTAPATQQDKMLAESGIPLRK